MTMALPVQAQVDWGNINGRTGQAACPSGVTEERPGQVVEITAPGAGSRTAVVGNRILSYAGIRAILRTSATRLDMWLYINDSKGNEISTFWNLGTLTSTNTQIAANTRTTPDLNPGERYSARVYPVIGGTRNRSNPLAVACFQMPPDLNYVEDLGKGMLGATGCFAIGGVALGGGDAAIRACFCGARNRLGKWARTGTVEPGTNLTDDVTYKWMMSSADRTRRGCTSN